jgi:hypothetical protein
MTAKPVIPTRLAKQDVEDEVTRTTSWTKALGTERSDSSRRSSRHKSA